MEMKKTETENGKYIDKGKVKALYEAGWQIPNIAWDIGTDEKTIREILGKLREKGIIR